MPTFHLRATATFSTDIEAASEQEATEILRQLLPVGGSIDAVVASHPAPNRISQDAQRRKDVLHIMSDVNKLDDSDATNVLRCMSSVMISMSDQIAALKGEVLLLKGH